MLKVRLYNSTRWRLERTMQFVSATFSGIWLGLLDREDLFRIDQQYYDTTPKYSREDYNRQGLWPWEQAAVDEYFFDCGTVLIAAAGGGREVLALSRLGYEVRAFECNEKLVAFANQLLASEGCASRVEYVPPDECPKPEGPYDALIIGWGAYMHINGRARRVQFLKTLRAHLRPNSPVLLSFYGRSPKHRSFKLSARAANAVRALRFKSRVEEGDCLDPNYCHAFLAEEIEFELKESGFEMVYFGKEQYCRAVGRAVE